MRPQARPFMVETKSRRRATQPETSASFARNDDWVDLVPPDELPERSFCSGPSGTEGIASGGSQQARRRRDSAEPPQSWPVKTSRRAAMEGASAAKGVLGS